MPVKRASRKQNRQDEHIEASAKRKGRSTQRAKETAARTVNVQKAKKRQVAKRTGR
jgi:hypothetical protein